MSLRSCYVIELLLDRYFPFHCRCALIRECAWFEFILKEKHGEVSAHSMPGVAAAVHLDQDLAGQATTLFQLSILHSLSLAGL